MHDILSYIYTMLYIINYVNVTDKHGTNRIYVNTIVSDYFL